MMNDASDPAANLAAELSVALDGARVRVVWEDRRVHVDAEGEIFAALGRVKRQQLIYRLLKARIGSGEIHALTMTTRAPGERA